MAPHSSTLAWQIPWTEEPDVLQSMGSRLSDFNFTFHFPALEGNFLITEPLGKPICLSCACLKNKYFIS